MNTLDRVHVVLVQLAAAVHLCPQLMLIVILEQFWMETPGATPIISWIICWIYVNRPMSDSWVD